MRAFLTATAFGTRITGALAAAFWLIAANPAWAQDAPTDAGDATATQETGTAADDASPPAEDAAEAPPSGTDILSRRTFSVVIDARLVGADGGLDWLDGGFGKTRFDGDSTGDFQVRPLPMQATLVWQPRFTDWLGATVSAGWQRGQDQDIDVMEAFLSVRPNPAARTRFSARAGVFWPNISLEHAGAAWSVTETITPSAINAWISEEVKVLGLEATIATMLGEHEVSLTGAAFGFNDTSGTLLSFRGWGLHDMNATIWGYFPLPPLNAFMTNAQAAETKSLVELDDRIGFYGNIEWRPPWPFGVNLFYYDNQGDPEVFENHRGRQWGWRTRFWNIGVNADLGPATRLLAQAMTGTTLMGLPFPLSGGPRWVDTRFRALYLLVRHDLGRGAITGRLDLFDTQERGSFMDNVGESEDGWALTVAGRYRVTDQLKAFVEAMHVSSERGVRQRLGQQPEENQFVFQVGLRLEL